MHEQAEYLLRQRLFEELLKEEKFLEAANCLGKLNLDASSGQVCVACCDRRYETSSFGRGF